MAQTARKKEPVKPKRAPAKPKTVGKKFEPAARGAAGTARIMSRERPRKA